MASANSLIRRIGKRSIFGFPRFLMRFINGSSPGPHINKTSAFFELDSLSATI